VEWLKENVGKGNITNLTIDRDDYDWFYQVQRVWPQGHEAFDPRDMQPRYVPTITIKDPETAMLFMLRWGK
jgi:hypothetical protein